MFSPKAGSSSKPLSIRAYARHRKSLGMAGGTHRAVQVAIESGRLAKSITADGKIASADDADAEWAGTTRVDRIPITGPTAAAHLEHAPPAKRRAGESQPKADEPPDFLESRARREAAAAALVEIELGEKRGELVPAIDVESKLVNTFAQCKTKLLAVPSRARQRDPALTGAQVELFKSLIREALTDLAGKAEQ